MATLVTVETAAAKAGKSVRSIWRYVEKLEAAGEAVSYRLPGLQKSLIDWDIVGPAALSVKRGNPRHRESRESRNI